MKRKRRRFNAEFKLKVILESLSERYTMTELSQKYEVHPNQISKWKQEFLNKAAQIMGAKASKNDEAEVEREKLYAKIGQLQMEVDFLKKKLF